MRARGRVLVGAITLVAIGAGAIVAIAQPFGNAPKAAGSVDNGAAVSLASITRESLSAKTQVNATLGYAGSYSIVNQAQGTITALPAVGEIVKQGEVLYRVNGAPVVLLYGTSPAYRALAAGVSASDVKGADVRQLNGALVALGYATRAQLDPTSDEFSSRTKAAVKKLQAHLGVTVDGALTLGQVVFVPTAARVTSLATQAFLGAQAAPGAPVLDATSPGRLVMIDLDATQQSEVKAGDPVTITLPDQRTTPGVVWSVGTVATAASSDTPTGSTANPTIAVEVVPTDPAATGTLDKAPVTVAITTATAKNVLAVPVNALLALASSGYAVEEVASDGTHHLVQVQLGLFDDLRGLVEVSGAGISASQRVVVPAS
ncbi:MAG TPA: peptidoglycan-binding domain-containing protein [Acidimicrobiia bacterium]|nr:peptidoglycan-binding domain-containing protein [Acidimicrobiia bacterium]